MGFEVLSSVIQQNSKSTEHLNPMDSLQFFSKTIIVLKLSPIFILNNHCDRTVFDHNSEQKFHDQQNIVCPAPAVLYPLPVDYQIVQISSHYRLLDLELLLPEKYCYI